MIAEILKEVERHRQGLVRGQDQLSQRIEKGRESALRDSDVRRQGATVIS
jgi:hypothetical protein